jgi:hypothetical protein
LNGLGVTQVGEFTVQNSKSTKQHAKPHQYPQAIFGFMLVLGFFLLFVAAEVSELQFCLHALVFQLASTTVRNEPAKPSLPPVNCEACEKQ